jgi:hypothetical protein
MNVMNRTYQSWIFLAITARLVTPKGFLLRGIVFRKPYQNCSWFNCVYMFSFGFANFTRWISFAFSTEAVDILFFSRSVSTGCFCFSFLAVVRFLDAFEPHSVFHCNMYNCSGQTVLSITRIFRDQRFWNVLLIGSTILYANEDLCNRRETSNACNIGELNFINSNFCLLLILWKFSCFICVFCLFLLFQVPAHILCLTVASGWNKERCTPEINIIVTLTPTSSILV